MKITQHSTILLCKKLECWVYLKAMCGIAGLLLRNKKEYKKEKSGNELASIMLKEIAHRGPDDQGLYADDMVAFGMRRLSIIDLEGGHQPISTESGNFNIVFNGEIYNFQELREKLISGGVGFKTNTDTEVILKLYEQKGESLVNDLRGMFAFAIYDKQKSEIFIARDQFGIKPLYYSKENEKVQAFASEIKSILSLSDKKYKINEEGLYNYLSYQYNPFEETLFSGIYKLPPGHHMKIDVKSGVFKIKKYYEFEFDQDEKMDEKKGCEELKKILQDSVKHHMIADVPVGSFLSGGVDSATIATLAHKNKPDENLHTFTVGGKEFNEFKEAREISDLLNTKHTEILLDPKEYFDELPKIARHFDEPVADPSAIALYFLARGASEKVKVVMSGEGSDELFGGYNIYREPFAIDILRKKMPKFILKPLLHTAKLIPFSFWGLNYLKRAGKKLEERYIGNANIFQDGEMKKIWKAEKQKKFNLEPLYEKVNTLSDSAKMQYVDINTWLVGDILAKADKMTMAHSLELRVPFLDMQIAEFAKKIPDELKFKNGETKYLFRKSVGDLLPKVTQKRKKLGFPIPVAKWLRDEKTWINTILENKLIRKYLNEHHIKSLIKKHKTGKCDNTRKIFVLLMLSTWYNQYKDKLVI